jgi:2-oxoglutarate dehydrogenase E2 component (dihydrolipoamide succinyltransferase)
MPLLEMKVPSPGESISEVVIANWLVKSGDWVEKDQAIAEIDSDKATLELSAEASGIIQLKVDAGATVAVGDMVCTIDTDAARPAGSAVQKEAPKKVEEKKADAPVQAKPAAAEKSDARTNGLPSPSAAKIMAENNLAAQKEM